MTKIKFRNQSPLDLEILSADELKLLQALVNEELKTRKEKPQ